MDYIAYAVPFFLLLIVLEIIWGVLHKSNTYRVNDSINSLSLGMLSTLTKLVFLNVGMLIFLQIKHTVQWFRMEMASPLHWLAGILLYDSGLHSWGVNCRATYAITTQWETLDGRRKTLRLAASQQPQHCAV